MLDAHASLLCPHPGPEDARGQAAQTLRAKAGPKDPQHLETGDHPLPRRPVPDLLKL